MTEVVPEHSIQKVTRWGIILYWFLRGIAYGIAHSILRIRITNRDLIPQTGSLLVCCNHMSHLDPPMVAVVMPRIIFHMAKQELFNIPGLKSTMRTTGTILVDRRQGRRAIEDAIQYCKSGRAVVIFPEGTRTVDGRLKRGRTGAIAIAIKSGVPILPMAVWGTDKAMPKGHKLIRPANVFVSIGQPYTIDCKVNSGTIPREILDLECYRLMEKIEELLPPERRPTLEEKRRWYGDLVAEQLEAGCNEAEQVLTPATD